ncbi:MAG: hypothetical protein WC728_02510 [Elusimicrobiota bacterium]
MKKLISTAVSTVIVLMSPGIGVYNAFANNIAAQAVNSGAGANVAPVVLNVGTPLSGSSLIGSQSRMKVGLTGALPAAANAPTVQPATLQTLGTALPQPAVSQAVRTLQAQTQAAVLPVQAKSQAVSQKETPAAVASRKLTQVSAGVSQALESVGPVAQARPESAHSLGSKVMSLLSGGVSSRYDESTLAPQGKRIAGMHGLSRNGERYFAVPAGKESIEAAVRAHNDETPQPPAPPQDEPVKKETPQAPLAARIFSAGVAAAPILILGLPLFFAGATWAGILVSVASVSLMAMPFMGENTPKFVRTLPGFAVAGLGLFTLGAGIMTGTGVVMGALVALGGWGLVRYGRMESRNRYDDEKLITAFFGAIAAVTGAGLVAMAPAAIAAAWTAWIPALSSAAAWLPYGVIAAKVVSYPVAALLLMHLPGWVGEGIGAVAMGLFMGPRAVSRVLNSMSRDTVARERLSKYSEKKLELSVWNVFKVGAFWIPVWVSEGVGYALSLVSGLGMAALQAPGLFLWGAAHKLAKDSAITKYLAAYNRYVFDNAQGSKAAVYNKLVTPLVPYANSESALKSVPAILAMKLAQAGWLAYALAATPVLHAVGLVRAFSKTSEPYDPEKHEPYLRLNRNDRPLPLPDVGEIGPVKDLIPPGLFATGLALLPMVFFGLPLWGMPVFGHVFAAAALSLAAMPLLPVKTPVFVRQSPGYVLTGLGLATMVLVPWLTFGKGMALAVLSSNPFWMGAVAALSGLGFINHIRKMSTGEDTRRHWVDDPEYIGAFFGALGVLTGLGVALTGLPGLLGTGLTVAAYLTSGLLLMHLPRWFWSGVGNVFSGISFSGKNFYDVLSFWRHDTKFYKNMKAHARYYLQGGVWKVAANATWLSVIWVPTGLVMLAEWLASLGLGLAWGLVKAPTNWLWGAAYRADPDSKSTRFIAGFGRAWAEMAEGSKKSVFDRMIRRYAPALDDAHPVTGRPTLKAMGSMVWARIAQLFWLLYVVAGTPVFLALAVWAGIENASGPKVPGEGRDLDDPRTTY